MQATIAGINSAENNDGDQAKKLRAGVIWEDWDFETLGLYPYCLTLDVAPGDGFARRRNSCIIHAWRKNWEDDCGPNGCPILEQHILRKYGGLQFVDLYGGKKFTIHQYQVSFQKARGTNHYELF